MGLRPTKTKKGASDRCRGIDNWGRAFNRVFPARIPKTVKHPRRRRALTFSIVFNIIAVII